jgi:hypothetical protein
MRTRTCTSSWLAFHHRCHAPGTTVSCSPAATVRSPLSSTNVTRPRPDLYRELMLRPASRWRERYALAEGDHELAVFEGKGWGRRPVKITVVIRGH